VRDALVLFRVEPVLERVVACEQFLVEGALVADVVEVEGLAEGEYDGLAREVAVMRVVQTVWGMLDRPGLVQDRPSMKSRISILTLFGGCFQVLSIVASTVGYFRYSLFLSSWQRLGLGSQVVFICSKGFAGLPSVFPSQ
jgi:hypothetical protein